jgi:hypothetical protein
MEKKIIKNILEKIFLTTEQLAFIEKTFTRECNKCNKELKYGKFYRTGRNWRFTCKQCLSDILMEQYEKKQKKPVKKRSEVKRTNEFKIVINPKKNLKVILGKKKD